MNQLTQRVPNEMSSWQWHSAKGEVSITIEAEIVERIKHQVLAAFIAIPKRGMETGGILLGRIDSVRPLSVTVEQIEPIACEHRSGPGFILSESDRAELARQLTAPRKDGLVVLGCYRSCTGRELGFDTNDQEVMDEFWPDPQHIFLATQPVSKHECVAAFLFRKNGRLQTRPDHLPFPFRTVPPPPGSFETAELATEGKESLRESEEHLVAGPVHPLTTGKTDDLREAPRRRRPSEAGPRRRTWVFALICLALAAALFVGRDFWRSLAEPRWTQLGLNVRSTESGLQVSWDASTPEVRNAAWGVLAVSDRGFNSEIELNRDALARGTFTYRNSGNNVLVRFRVGGTYAGDFGETFRFVSETRQPTASTTNVAGANSSALKGIEAGSPPAAPEPITTQQQPKAEGEAAATDVQAKAPESSQSERESNAVIVSSATPVHEVQPFVPEGIRGRITEQIIVPVTVRISAAGRVTSAVPEGDGDTVYRYLASRAAVAAKLWRFEPARSAKGTRTASTKILHFVFMP